VRRRALGSEWSCCLEFYGGLIPTGDGSELALSLPVADTGNLNDLASRFLLGLAVDSKDMR
jgi:hypothetical protein